MWQRIFRGRGAAERSTNQPPLPDPMDKFPHPGNLDFFDFLIRSWPLQAPQERIFSASPHLDLVQEFDEITDQLVSIGDVKKSIIYGVRFAVTRDNLVFAWAHGMRGIFIKLPQEQHKAAVAVGGRLDATYPPNWVEFLAWGARMPARYELKWRQIILHWMQVSYDEYAEILPSHARPDYLDEL